MQNSEWNLAGKAILVTGASSGIGAATAVALGRQRARVVLAARRVGDCETVAEQVRAAGGEAWVTPVDVADEASVQRCVEAAVQRFGRLDGAFNNAGALGTGAPLHTLAAADVQAVLQANVMGIFHAMKHQIAAMLASGGGAIVNNLSISSGVAFAGISAYTASKHAALGLTRNAALEYFQQRIRVNAVSPGPTITPMPQIAMACGCFFGGLMLSRIDCDSGTSEAPKRLWSSLAATICASESEMPHSTEAAVKPAIEAHSNCVVP